MNSFQYIFYSIQAKKEKSSIELIFHNLVEQIELYEKQFELTLEMYKTERKRESDTLEKEYMIEKERRKSDYDRLYEEMKGQDEQTRDGYASLNSGLDLLEHEHDENNERLKEKYSDFFDTYSKFVLVALYSLIESSLKNICDTAGSELDEKIKYEHLVSKNYIEASLNYFTLVLDMSTSSLESDISKIREIQLIRNKIIHSQSKFSSENYTTINNIVAQEKGNLLLIKENSDYLLSIKKSNYIINCFLLCWEFFGELFWLVDSRFKNKVLQSKLEYWFGMLDKRIFIRNIEVETKGKGKRKVEFDLSSRKKNIPKFKCKVTIARAKKNSLSIIDQTDNESVASFNKLVESNKSFLFDYVFELFNLSGEGLKLEIMMF